jgi:hypothetical protein
MRGHGEGRTRRRGDVRVCGDAEKGIQGDTEMRGRGDWVVRVSVIIGKLKPEGEWGKEAETR